MLNFGQKKVYKGHKNNKSTHRRLWRPRRSLSKHTSSGGFQPPQHQVEHIFILCPFDCCGGRRPPLLLHRSIVGYFKLHQPYRCTSP